jgi:hypothetical protein
MTRRNSARVAGATFLLYIVIGITQMVIGSGSTSGGTTAQRLASVAAHASQIRMNLLLTFVISVIALTLAVTLYGITRDEDHELSTLALICRVIEGGVTPVISMFGTLSLLSLATSADARAGDAATSFPVVEFLPGMDRWPPIVAGTFFAIGSTIFTYLMLRGRMIPSSLAWLGLLASVLLVVALPLQLVGILSGLVTQLMWIPMAAFEIPLGVWLIVKGVAPARAG